MSIVETYRAAHVTPVGESAAHHFEAARGNPDECWVWRGATDRDGYGLCTILAPKRTRGAHRVAIAMSLGIEVDDLRGKVVMHHCDNPPCVNPSHLSARSQRDNVHDMHAKGRANSGRTHCLRGHELTDNNVYVHRATGKRRCAVCHRARQAAYNRRKRA